MNRREQAEWRRERLLDAALEAFVSKGIDRATMKDIAQAAGVTPGLLYHYFDGKDTLLATLLEERSFLSKLRRQLAGATDRAATVVLPEMVRAYRQVLTENRGLVSLFFSASSTNRHVRTAMGEFVAEGQRLLVDYPTLEWPRANCARTTLGCSPKHCLRRWRPVSTWAPTQIRTSLSTCSSMARPPAPLAELPSSTRRVDTMRTYQTRCCIAGGGPAGMMLGLLLARQGQDVVVLEKHADFLRDFRGDTVHPSTLELVAELGWLEEFLRLPHTKLSRVTIDMKGRPVTFADFGRLPTRCRYVAFMPQWDFLDFLADKADQYPGFRLVHRAEVTDLIVESGRIVGVRAQTPTGPLRCVPSWSSAPTGGTRRYATGRAWTLL